MNKIAVFIIMTWVSLFTSPQAYALSIALVIGNSAAPDANIDTPLANHLAVTLGHTVTIKDDGDSSYDPTVYDCVVISESVNSGSTGWLKNEIVPLVTAEGSNYDEYELGSGGNSNNAAGTDVDIQDAAHYIAAGLSGTVPAYTVAANIGYITGWANDVHPIAVYSANTSQATILYVEKGGRLRNGVNTAADRRVFFAARYFNNLDANGVAMFNAALQWATRTIPNPSSNADVFKPGVSFTRNGLVMR